MFSTLRSWSDAMRLSVAAIGSIPSSLSIRLAQKIHARSGRISAVTKPQFPGVDYSCAAKQTVDFELQLRPEWSCPNPRSDSGHWICDIRLRAARRGCDRRSPPIIL